MRHMCRVKVVVTYYADVELPADVVDAAGRRKYIQDHWEDYDDDLTIDDSERSVVEAWDEDPDHWDDELEPDDDDEGEVDA